MEGRVTLRDFRMEDVEAMMEWTVDESVVRFTSWEAYTCREEVQEYMEKQVINHPFYKAICVDGCPVGSLALTRGVDSSSCRAEIGYVLASKWWSKGITTISVKMAASLAFQHMPDLHRIEALIDPANIASQRVVEKTGFVKEGLLLNYVIMKGTLRDMFIYRFLRSDHYSI